MSSQPLIVEGTWQEVAEIGARYADRRVWLTILPPEQDPFTATTEPTAEEPFVWQLVEEGGILALASLPTEVADWGNLVEQARKEREGSFGFTAKGSV